MFDLSKIKPRMRVQLHVLKSHTASNLNRDDLGRPKTMSLGGVPRLRISSQSVKRAIRMGEVFKNFREHAAAEFGATPMIRTTQVEALLVQALVERGLPMDKALEGAKAVSATLKKSDKGEGEDKPRKTPKKEQSLKEGDEEEIRERLEATQLLALSVQEIGVLADHLAAVQSKVAKDWAAVAIKELQGLVKSRKDRFMRGDLSPEMQLFGRMVTSDLFSNVDARVQVAHAFTVHEAQRERDYWTGVDDYREAMGQAGSGMIDTRNFGSGVFYQYACIDVDGLIENITAAHGELPRQKARELTRDLVNAFVIAFAGQNPTGYQNSFASHAMPEFMVAEIGGVFPHSAAAAYEVPVTLHDGGYSVGAAARFQAWLQERRAKFGQQSMGQLATMGLGPDSVTLEQFIRTVASCVEAV